MDKKAEKLIKDMKKYIDLNNHTINELDKYDDEIAEKIIELKDVHTSESYSEEEWEELYEKSKDNVALQIALIKNKELPFEYEEKIVDELPMYANPSVFESNFSSYNSLMKTLNKQLIHNTFSLIKLYFSQKVWKISQRAVNEFCLMPISKLQEYEFFPFEYLEFGKGSKVLSELRENKISNEHFWTAIANNRNFDNYIRNEALENEFIMTKIRFATKNMQNTIYKSCMEIINNAETEEEFKSDIVRDAIAELQILIMNQKNPELTDDQKIHLLNALKKDTSANGKNLYNSLMLHFGTESTSEKILKEIINEDTDYITENKHMTEELLLYYMEKAIVTDYVEQKELAHMVLSTDSHLSEQFYQKIIKKHKDIHFYCLLMHKMKLPEKVQKLLIENTNLPKKRMLFQYMRELGNCLKKYIYTNHEDFYRKVMLGIVKESNEVFMDSIDREINSQTKNHSFDNCFLTENQYEILKDSFKKLKKMYPDMKEMTENLEKKTEKRYSCSKLFNKHHCLFRYVDDREKGVEMDIEQFTKHIAYNNKNTKIMKELLSDIKEETNLEVLNIIKEEILYEHMELFQSHQLDGMYQSVYKLKDIYYEVIKREKELKKEANKEKEIELTVKIEDKWERGV